MRRPRRHRWLGKVNFLSDPSSDPHLPTKDLCKAFDVGESTVHAKARAIEKALAIHPLDPRWTLARGLEDNALVWTVEVNGLLVDLRRMPRDLQEAAFRQGLIPFVPADREASV